MRILFSSLGGAGHTYPLVPLALALRDDGHPVTFATGVESHDALTSAGLDAVAAGVDLRTGFATVSSRRGLTGPPTDPAVLAGLIGEVFGDVMPRAYRDDVGALIDEQHPDLVVAEAGCPGAAIAAALAGVPCVTHSFGRRPDPGSAMGEAIRSSLAALIAEVGLGYLPPGRFLGHAYLDVCPPSLQAPVLDPRASVGRELTLRPTPWNPAVPGFAARRNEGRRWVYLTLGTAMGDAEILRAAAIGLAELGVDVLLAAGSAPVETLRDLDDQLDGRVQVEAFVPQADLLLSEHPPSLVVHHGGSGTTLAAAAAGVPQLLLPQGADQFSNADALVRAGVGRALVGDDHRPLEVVTPEIVLTAARDLLADDDVRGAADALAAEVAGMPTTRDLAARVGAWARP